MLVRGAAAEQVGVGVTGQGGGVAWRMVVHQLWRGDWGVCEGGLLPVLLRRAQGDSVRHGRDACRGPGHGRKGAGLGRGTKPETIAITIAKPEVAEETYMVLGDPEKGDDTGAADGASK